MKRDNFFASHNFQDLAQGMDALLRADATRPRMGLVVGDFGSGKTKSVIRWAGQNHSIYVRALGEWRQRPLWLLHDLGAQIGDEVRQWQSTERMFREVRERLLGCKGIVFFDEAEYIVGCARLMAVVLVGGVKVLAKLASFEAAASRTLRRIDFSPLLVEEVRMFCHWRSGIELAEDAPLALHELTDGNFRLLDVALDKLEGLRNENPDIVFNSQVVRRVKPAITRAVREAQELARKAP